MHRSAAKSGALKQNITTLRNRVNELGVAEPSYPTAGLREDCGAITRRARYCESQRNFRCSCNCLSLDWSMRINDIQTLLFSLEKFQSGSKLYKFKDGTPLLLKTGVVVTGENIVDAASSVDQDNQPNG